MKNLIRIAASLVLLIALNQAGHSQTYSWAKKIGATGQDYGRSIASDASGNVYVTGHYNSTVDFDPGAGTANLVSAGGADIYVAKFNVSGNLVWAKSMGGTSNDLAYSVTVDGGGNVYVTGEFRATADFDPGAGTSNIAVVGASDIFVVKLDGNGNLTWARSLGGTDSERGQDIAVDVSGNVYVTGIFKLTVDFDPGAGTANLTSSGVEDMFVCKLNASGNFVWAKSTGGSSGDYSVSIALDAAGNSYTTGYFAGTVDFDPGAGTTSVTSGGNTDSFVRKLDASGNFVWAKTFPGNSGLNGGRSIAVNGNGDVYSTGYFELTVDFDPGVGTFNLTETNGGGEDFYISKLDASGNFVWAVSGGDAGGSAIALDPSGNVFIVGSFSGTVDFDPGAGTTNLTASGAGDMFMARFNAAGNLVWAKALDGNGTDAANDLTIDGLNNLCVTGYFGGTTDFDPDAGTASLSQGGNADFFIAQYTLPVLLNQTITFNALPAKTFGALPFALSATSSSGLTVSYTSSNTAVATVSGNTVSILAPGTTTITASQFGNSSYNAATPVNQTLTVNTLAGATTQYASTVIGFSSQYTSSNYAATKALGAPDVYPAYEDNLNAWAPVTVDGQREYLKLGFDIPMNVFRVDIYETFFPGSIDTVYLRNAATGVWNQVYSTTAASAAATSNILRVFINQTTYSVDAIRIAMNSPAVAGVEEIDAVAIVGVPVPDNTPPTVIISSTAPDPTNVSPIPVSFTFNENVTGFVSGDIGVLNGTVGNFSGSGKNYSADITPGGQGTLTVSVAANVANDPASNGNVAATSLTRAFDTQGPTVSVLSPSNSSTGFAANGNLQITFNENIQKGTGDIVIYKFSDLSVLQTIDVTSGNVTINNAILTINPPSDLPTGTQVFVMISSGSIKDMANNIYSGINVTTEWNFTTVLTSQTITFNSLPAKTFGDAAFALTGSASSGLTVSYASSNTSVATVSGSMVTIVGAGSTTITASQAGNATYSAAPNVNQTLTVNKANQSITFNALASKTFGDVAFSLTGTASSGLALSYISSNTSVATVSGSTVTIVGAGSTTITASQTGNTNYNAASDVGQTLTVNKANQTITFNPLVAKTFGDATFSLTGTASSGLAVSYSSSNTAVATISGSTVTIVGAGSTTITASQTGNTNYNAASTVGQTLTVNKANQTITFNPLTAKTFGNAAFSLTGTSSSGLPVSYSSSNTAVATVSGSTVTIVGAGSTTITASQTGNANYDAATDVGQNLLVNKANQTITFNALPAKTVGDAAFALTATASSGLPVSYASSNTSVATVSGATVTIVGVGSTNITASQTGNANYNAASDVVQPQVVNSLLSQTITFNALAPKTFGDAAFALTATASSGLTVSYSSSNTAVATVSGSTVTIVGVGSTTITASQAGNGTYNPAVNVDQTLTVNKANQAITFNALATKTFGNAAFSLTGTASSGLTVSYASSNTAVATVSGSTVTIVGAGSTTITASQTGNTNYNAAAPVDQTLTVNKANQTITFNTLSAKTFGDASFSLTGTASSGLAVSYVSSNTSVATVSGSTITIIGAGSTTITASQSGNSNYNAASDVAQALAVNKANQTITFNTLAARTFGDAAFSLTGTSSSGLAVSYVSSNTAVATVSGSMVTIVGAGSSTISASQAGNTDYNAASNVGQTLTVNKANQTITFNALPSKTFGDADFSLTGTSSSGLAVSYSSSNTAVATIAGSTVTIVGVGSTTITASQTGNANYNAASSVGQTLTVNKADQTISFSALPAKTVGDASFNLTATASSGLTVSYVSSNTSVATVSGSTVTIVGLGSTTITASQAGNANYNAAPSVDQIQVVNSLLSQTISFNPLPTKVFGDAPFTLSASASSGLSVSFTSSNTAVATISGSTVTIVGAGTTTIKASQTGDTFYNPASEVDQTLTVGKASQTITFNALPAKTLDDIPFELTATASSGLAVSYVSSNTSVATVSGSTVTIVGAGSTTIAASQVGNSNYEAAATVDQILVVSTLQPQTISFSVLPEKVFGDADFALSATASSGITVSYTSSNTAVATISVNMVTIVGAGSTIITASQAGNGTFSAASNVNQTLIVNKANQTITFNSLPDKNLGDASYTLTASTSSGLPVSYVSSNTSVATISGNTVTILGAGSTTITASQPGNGNYNAASPVDQVQIVNGKQNQSITFADIPAKTIGDPAFALSATASSNLPVVFSTTSDKITLSGNQVTIVKAGLASIKANQNGNSTFNAAPEVIKTFCINPAKPTITVSGENTESPVLTSSNPTGNQWFLNGTAIASATGVTLNVTAAGSYTVQSTVETCQSAMSSGQPVIITGDVSPVTAKARLYPNPAENNLYLSWPRSSGTISVVIYEMNGKPVERIKTEQNEIEVGVMSYAQGNYLVVIHTDNANHHLRFFKK